jgi:two-component system nitrate/nitrite response regulator NarL
MGEWRVLILGRDVLVRAGLKAMLANQAGIKVAGLADESDSVEQMVELYRPDVLIWDGGSEPHTRLPGVHSWFASGVPVLVLIPDSQGSSRLWEAGARGLLLREAGPERLAAAVAGLAAGLVVADPVLRRQSDLTWADESPEPIESLTPRELEVLELVANGLSNRAIAQRLELSEFTVKFHVNAILGKLNAESRTEAATRALRLGLIAL